MKISLFLTMTYLLGVLSLGWISGLLLPKYLLHPIKNPQMIHGLTAICSLFLRGYWAAVVFWRKPVIIKGLEFRLPSIAMTAGQTLISDQWLLKKHTREKGFFLGFFNEDYLCRTDVAVVYDDCGGIMAFASLWKNVGKQELSIDLMRYDPESPNGIMDFLLVELMLWGKTENYQRVSLGMPPLAGLERHPLAPLRHKIGTSIFDLGEEFHNFEGLYAYKAKFEPEWQPRYLAAPAGLSAPFILMTIARLIAGGWKGIFSK